MGQSLCEHDLAQTARDIADKAVKAGCTILLPRDVVVAKEFKAGAASETVKTEDVPSDAMILDAGPDSVAAYRSGARDRQDAGLERPPWRVRDRTLRRRDLCCGGAKAAELTKAGKLVSVAGGGDTVAALNHAGVAQDFSYVSTAGGAFLEWMGRQDPARCRGTGRITGTAATALKICLKLA